MKTLCFAKALLCAVLIGMSFPAISNAHQSTRGISSSFFQGGTIDIFQGKTDLFLAFSTPSNCTIRVLDHTETTLYTIQIPSDCSHHTITTANLLEGNYVLVVTTNTSETIFDFTIL